MTVERGVGVRRCQAGGRSVGVGAAMRAESPGHPGLGGWRESCLEPCLREGRWLALGRGQRLRHMPSRGAGGVPSG